MPLLSDVYRDQALKQYPYKGQLNEENMHTVNVISDN